MLGANLKNSHGMSECILKAINIKQVLHEFTYLKLKEWNILKTNILVAVSEMKFIVCYGNILNLGTKES